MEIFFQDGTTEYADRVVFDIILGRAMIAYTKDGEQSGWMCVEEVKSIESFQHSVIMSSATTEV